MAGKWSAQYCAIMRKNLLLSIRNWWEWFIVVAIPILILGFIYLFANAHNIKNFQAGMIEISLIISIFGYQRTILIREVIERGEGFREYLKIMGLKEGVSIAANLTYSYIVCSVSFGIMLIGVLAESFLQIGDLTFSVFIAQILFILAAVNFTFLLSLCFKSAKSAGDVGTLLTISLVVLTVAQYFLKEIWMTYAFCWVPQISYLGAISSNKTNRITGFLSLTLQSLLYVVLYFYLDQVIPNANGIKKHPLFFLKKRTNDSELLNDQNDNQNQLINNSAMNKTSAFYQEINPNSDITPVVYIDKLTKNFDSFCAVNNVSFGVYEKEVLCLLGHNGAGKTTLINMLCNIYKPSSGSILYQKQNIINDNEVIKGKVGYCSQTNFLYENLTTLEHLEMMAKIKGVSSNEEIQKIATTTGITQYLKNKSHQLSGGNKRKTCLAMALLGKPHMIFLDEPTSGLDPVSRRSFWDAIYNIKQDGSAIILTTHHLEEAEALSDKLAIISRGRLIIYGSSQYVKKVFSEGYTLTITLDKNQLTHEKAIEKIIRIKQIIATCIKTAKFNSQTSKNTVICTLPFSELQKFSKLFEELEELNDIEISINQNTLEETFILIKEKEEEVLAKHGVNPEESTYKNVKLKLDINNVDEFFKIKQNVTFFGLISAIFKKRILLSLRDPAFYLIFFIPVFILSILIWLTTFYALERMQFGSFEINYTLYIYISYYFIIFCYCLFSTLYVYIPVKERESGIRHLLRMSGCYSTAYFLGHFFADIVIHFISCFLIYCLICMMWIFSSNKALNIEFRITFLFFFGTLLFGCGFILYSYFLGYLFSKSITALKFFNLCLYGITIAISFIFEIVFLFSLSSKTIYYVYLIEQIFSPFYTWFVAISILHIHQGSKFEFKLGNPFVSIIIEVMQIIFLFFACIWLENNRYKYKNEKTIPHMAGDNMMPLSTLEEKKKVENQNNTFKIKVQNLYKTYHLNGQNTVYAVYNSNIGIENNSIFGLLGPNGAGKSTTFNILTSKISKTFGKVFINNIDIDSSSRNNIYKDVGYCSQDNIYWEQFTVYEHLTIFALLKGLPPEKINYICSYLINLMSLESYIHKKADYLSGGNKRKLCVCMAMISNPQILFLDEPSTGVDAVGKRYLWDSIKLSKSYNNSSVVLTTHTLYEAESLCDKIGIMINGVFQCIGTVQELKSLYGGGYQLILHVRREECKNNIANLNLLEKLNEIVPNAQIQPSKIQGEIVFRISKKMFKLGNLFQEMEKWKEMQWCDDYSLLEDTLEHVFIELCKHQHIVMGQFESLKVQIIKISN